MPEPEHIDVDVQLPYGPPPVLPDVEKQLQEYLLCPDRLPIHNYEKAQQFWPRVPNPKSLYHYDLSPLGTTLKVDRDPTTGKLLQFREVAVDDMGCNAKNSMSMRRAPGPPSESLRGNVTNFPFWPGGFPELSLKDLTDDEAFDITLNKDFLTVAPGLSRGVMFKADRCTPMTEEDLAQAAPTPTVPDPETPILEQPLEVEGAHEADLMDALQREGHLLDLWKESAGGDKDRAKSAEKTLIQGIKVDAEELQVIPEKDNIPVLKISKAPPLKSVTKTKWAELIDVTQPVKNFHEKLPDMAHTFTFDLDTFQQQAILKVEQHDNVFVAAHTSAGKTVVAEYAIALSQRHMTRAVYTSPIKALSNQKFRDFKKTFKDVGLITGDMQLNTTGSCLIMTTEILRSMLYQGSEVVRDLEFVIFDEVHYINNAERGHVWEEVLILLPKDVCIIMLSATVPNTLEFADWVGRTKQKKMYVINTPKRPVPLEHFLYTGTSGKHKNERFIILDAQGKFVEKGYTDAKAAKDARKNPYKAGFGPKQARQVMSSKQEATMWVALIDHLSHDHLLPIVAFTLSRNRCDENARNLGSVDLTTAREKSRIHQFFERCLLRLKEPDKILPQVVQMQSLLKQGIGVHHSGILPILKEIVEMLFQEGLVKLLFATETFAMGVNMPARTVIFDSIRKFDGQGMRGLLPAEYIQMAGRAGRRGLDSTGTVIIISKMEVPPIVDLKAMMLGKPEKLTSQFRLTYNMILRLLRVEKITVEDMMLRSFMEFGKQTRQDQHQVDLKAIEIQIAALTTSEGQTGVLPQLVDLYNDAADVLELWVDTRAYVLSLSRAQKDLVPGRILVVNHKEHINKLGILLQCDVSRRDKVFRVLVLCNDVNPTSDGEIRLSLKSDAVRDSVPQKVHSEEWYKMMGLATANRIFTPDGLGGHTIIYIGANDITEIAAKCVKINVEMVIKDWEQRQLPRFRDDPPGQSCNQAIQELTQLSLTHADASTLPCINNSKDGRITDSLMIRKLDRIEVLRQRILELDCANMPNFEEQFELAFDRKQLERKRENLKYLQSNQSMTLYPDYQMKVQVLENMRYIEDGNIVTLKGKVAIKMRNHELIITELVLRNILTGLPEAEIAALLSCLVFQQRTKEKCKIETESLRKGIEAIKKVEEDIRREEKRCGVEPGVVDNNKLNFELVEVVYEWAREKPFADIMKLTDVQEGIIVRCIQQLNETLRDVKDAASIIGDSVLGTKMEDASRAIKRDIVFAASLYTSETGLA